VAIGNSIVIRASLCRGPRKQKGQAFDADLDPDQGKMSQFVLENMGHFAREVPRMEDTQAIATTAAVPVEGGGPKSFPAASPLHQAFESGRYPYARLLGRVAYEAEKAKLQAELLKVQIWAQETGQKFVILMEGRDAAGKAARSSGSWSI
jgi:hypothetical protein